MRQRPRLCAAGLALALACAPGRQPTPPEPSPPPSRSVDPGRVVRPQVEVPRPEPAPEPPLERVAPPEVAYARDWMALGSTGVDRFLRAHPTWDGRGVLIAILDTGLDPGIPGLRSTSTGEPKVLDIRDFSAEGAVTLTPVTARGDTVMVAGRHLAGFGRVLALNTAGPWFGGAIAELPLGRAGGADLNGNDAVGDTLPVVVTRATDGWVLLADTDGDGSLAGERPVHDYLFARETFGWAPRGGTPPLDVAVNFGGDAAAPTLDLVVDLDAHGSHVAGIAAAHDLYGVTGFDGVAPGAQLIAAKIGLGAQGSVSTTGAMLRAMDYAIRFAAARRLPLVMNLSFGVGNELEGRARIDLLVDSVLAAHPDVSLTISGGNDGPGLSTVGLPGSAERAITVGATLPAAFLLRGTEGARPEEVAYFSSRGGELAKPDIVTPGMAYSSVPRWSAGDEVKQGTSMASPHAAGLVANLVSALVQEKRPIDAARIKRALMVTARPTPAGDYLDEGRGLPDLAGAWQWLATAPAAPRLEVRGPDEDTSAGWLVLRPGAPPAGTVRFELLRTRDAPAGTYSLRSDAAWLAPPAKVTTTGPRTAVEVRYDATRLAPPGAYTGTVSGWGSDTLAGPAFRLVTTVISPAPATDAAATLRQRAPIGGGTLRSFFLADTARPFEVEVGTGGLAERALAFLHEPHGVPYRDESGRPAGGASLAARFQVDGRDVVSGAYEIDAVSFAGRPATADIRVTHSPLTLQVTREGGLVRAGLGNVTARTVDAQVKFRLRGGERADTVATRGSDTRRVQFTVPAWASSLVVDVAMDREQWERFTDFGVSVFDSSGRQLAKDPLNYAFGRTRVDLPERHGDVTLTLALYPGFADLYDDAPWSVRTWVRTYADSGVALAPVATGDSTARVAPGRRAQVIFELGDSPWRLPERFYPLGALIVRTGEEVWTRETGLPAGGAAVLP